MSTFDPPPIFRVRQNFQTARLDNVAAAVEEQLGRLNLGERIRPGQSVAIPVGSRGISNIAEIVRAIVGHLRSLGGEPFIVPAMGSHANGDAAGQQRLIEGYGVTEDFCGCPIRSSMDTVTVCTAAEGFPVHFDRHAFQADHVMVVGRVKLHTDFTGDIQSGLMKMMLIGLGKHEGAKIYHRAIQDYNFNQIVRSVAAEVLAKCNILCGLAILENALDETMLIEAIAPHEIESREKQLLRVSADAMPSLPFQHADVLVVDEIGKDISGSGMDTNIVGRKFNDNAAAADEFPKIRRILVRGLTQKTHGNAIGLGIADFCHQRALAAMDRDTLYTNCITSGHVSAGFIPLNFATDREMLSAALATIGLTEPPAARVMWIRNTLELAEVECSAAYLGEAQQRPELTVLTEPRAWPFDAAGNLPSVDLLAAE